MWPDGDFWLNKDVFESLKLVRNLGCMNLWWAEGVARKDVDHLLEACSELKEALCNEDLLDKIYGDSLQDIHRLEIGNRSDIWFENGYPCWDTSWGVSLRYPQNSH